MHIDVAFCVYYKQTHIYIHMCIYTYAVCSIICNVIYIVYIHRHSLYYIACLGYVPCIVDYSACIYIHIRIYIYTYTYLYTINLSI